MSATPEVGNAHVAIVPSLKGFRRAVSGEVDKAASESKRGFQRGMRQAGELAGREAGQGFGEAVSKAAEAATKRVAREVATATRDVSSARLAAQDAAGKLRVAESALAAEQQKSSRALKDVERATVALERARDTGSVDAVTRAEKQLERAQAAVSAQSLRLVAAEERQQAAMRKSASSVEQLRDKTERLKDSREELNRVRLEEQELKVLADLDDTRAREKLKKLVEDQKVSITTDVFSAPSKAKLELLTRPRVVEILPKVSAPALAAAATALAALSGGRVLDSSLGRVKDMVTNLDKALPKIAGVSMAIAGLGSVALTSVSGLGSVAIALSQISGLALMLPALLTQAAAVIAVLVVAWKDAGTVLGDLGPLFTGLGEAISASYWERAAEPIREMAQTIMPQLQESLVGISGELGGLTGAFASAFQQSSAAGLMGSILESIRVSIAETTPAVAPFVNGMMTLGEVGAKFLPDIAKYLTDAANRFDSWATKAAASGELAAWISRAAEQFGFLMDVLRNFGGVLSGVFNALGSSDAGLKNLAENLGKISDVVNGPTFQTALSTIFSGAASAASSLAAALKPVGDALAGLAPALGGGLAKFGETLRKLIEGIAGALNQPVVADGLTSLIDGISAGIDALLPSLPSLGSALGSVLAVGGELARVIGPVLGAAIDALGPVFDGLAAAVTPLIQELGPLLTEVVMAVADALIAIMPSVVKLGESLAGLLPVLSPLIVALAEGFGAVLEVLAPVLADIVTVLADGLMVVFEALSPLIQPVVDLVVQLAGVIGDSLLGIIEALVPQLADWVAKLIELLPSMVPVIQALIDMLPPILALIPSVIDLVFALIGMAQPLLALFPLLMQLVAWILERVVPAVTGFMRNLKGLIDFITGVFSLDWDKAWSGIKDMFHGQLQMILSLLGISTEAWNQKTSEALQKIKDALAGFGNFVSDVWNNNIRPAFDAIANGIKNFFNDPGGWLLGVGKDIVQGLVNGINSMAGKVADAIKSIAKSVTSTVKNALDIRSPSRKMRVLGEFTGEGFEDGILAKIPAVSSAVRRMVALPTVGDVSVGVSAFGAAGGASGGTQNVFNLTVEAPPGASAAAVLHEFKVRMPRLVS